MELLLSNQTECQRVEVYNEYLRKSPELLKQLDTVEKMYQKALLEEEMLKGKEENNHSVILYHERLERIKKQCEERSADIRQQCRLIFELKDQIEKEARETEEDEEASNPFKALADTLTNATNSVYGK